MFIVDNGIICNSVVLFYLALYIVNIIYVHIYNTSSDVTLHYRIVTLSTPDCGFRADDVSFSAACIQLCKSIRQWTTENKLRLCFA